MKNIMIILALGLLLFGCVNQAAPQNATNPPADITPVNNTQLPPPAVKPAGLPPGYSVSIGDNVSVWYTLYVKGNAIDTNNKTQANESGIFNPKRKYEPFNVSVEFNKGLIDGFVLGLVGMRINETLYFDVDPKRGYGPYDMQKVMVIPRYYEKDLYETVPLSFFEDQKLNVTKGAAFDTPYGTVFIDNFTESNVTLFYVLVPGANLSVNGIPQSVVSLTNLTAKMEFMLVENQTYVIPNPETGAKAAFLVTSKTAENITLDGNHPLANETLRFKVTLIDAVPFAK